MLIFEKHLCFPILFLSLCVSLSCTQKKEQSLSQEETIPIPECGIILPLSYTLEEQGLVIDSYGTNRTRYPMTVVSFSYLPAIDSLYAEYGSLDPALVTEDTVQEFRQKIEAHSQPLATIIAVPTKEYKAYQKNGFPKEMELLSGMHELGKKYGNTYLFLTFENDTAAMQPEEKELFTSIKRSVIYATQNAQFTKISPN